MYDIWIEKIVEKIQQLTIFQNVQSKQVNLNYWSKKLFYPTRNSFEGHSNSMCLRDHQSAEIGELLTDPAIEKPIEFLYKLLKKLTFLPNLPKCVLQLIKKRRCKRYI